MQKKTLFIWKYQKKALLLRRQIFIGMSIEGNRRYLSELYQNYKSEIPFALTLAFCVGMSMWLSRYIPVAYFDNVVTPAFNISITVVALFGAILMFKHSEGLRIRRAWGYCLAIWGILEFSLLAVTYDLDIPIYNVDADESVKMAALVVGNFMGWLLLIYPTEALRPGWLNLRRAAMQFLPMFALVIINLLIPVDLSWLISLYPLFLAILLIRHLHVYRAWCEENYSSMDYIGAQWIVRYFVMLTMAGIELIYLGISDDHMRIFTQQWLIPFMFAYSTVQILFRRDPWENITVDDKEWPEAEEGSDPIAILETGLNSHTDTDAESEIEGSYVTVTDGGLVAHNDDNQPDTTDYSAYRETLENWMASEKPYLNPEFRLLDLRQVLPLNRTYLSQLINNEYDCNFYQYVTRYRIVEAMRLMRECPELKIQDISSQSGFSSPTVFARTFTRETGLTPREWNKQN